MHESETAPLDWRQPDDDFRRELETARVTLLANTTRPFDAVAPFEPILEELRRVRAVRDAKLPRIRSLGRELFAELSVRAVPVSMEVRHYCWHLQHLGDPNASPASSVQDMLMVTLTRFAHYEHHERVSCSICAEFPQDLPFQGSPGGRAHLREWVQRRSGGST
jgi:hypothetical protein